MRERIYWNRDWQFTTEYSEEILKKEFEGELQSVTLPHTVAETPFHYFDESIYQMVSGYRTLPFSPPISVSKTVVFVPSCNSYTVGISL